MKPLLTALTAAILAGLPSVRWVGVLDSELLPPEEPSFPLVGLKDGGILHASQPGRKDLDTLTVHVVSYQSITLAEPGGAVMGSPAQLGTQGTGLLDLSAALRVLLNDNFLGLSGVHYAHCDRQFPTETLAGDGGRLIQLQRLTFTYSEDHMVKSAQEATLMNQGPTPNRLDSAQEAALMNQGPTPHRLDSELPPTPNSELKVTLTYTGLETRSLGGVGIFAKDLPPLQVTDSIAHQYDTPEMKKLGWIVAWVDETSSASPKSKVLNS